MSLRAAMRASLRKARPLRRLLRRRPLSFSFSAIRSSTLASAAAATTAAPPLGGPSVCTAVVPAFDDNYIYACRSHGRVGPAGAVLVDPADPAPALEAVGNGDGVAAVLVTHKHADHWNAKAALAISRRNPEVRVYAPSAAAEGETLPGVTDEVQGGDEFGVGDLWVRVLDTPYHTRGHISYVVEKLPGGISAPTSRPPPALFCGDAMFVGGCGRFFEGDGNQLMAAFEQFRELPPETQVFCGHEYTESNLQFALHVDPHNTALQNKMRWVQARRAEGLPTVPSTLGEEWSYNPFARVSEPEIRAAVGAHAGATDGEVADLLRAMKDNF